MNHGWFKALLLAAVMASPAHARVDSGAASFAAVTPMANINANAAPQISDQINSIIEMRTLMMDRAAPQPTTDCTDPKMVLRRVAALRDLDTFARMTINGLIDAAPSSDLKAATSDELAPVLIHHRQVVTASLRTLLDLPLVRAKSDLAADVGRLAAEAARP